MARRNKKKDVVMLIGLTAIILTCLALFIVMGEQLELITFTLGYRIGSLSPMDSWLIVILSVFAPGIFLSLFMLYRFKIIEVD